MKIGVIGLGYVGLPLAVSFAEAGDDVVAVDVDPRKIAALKAGESYVEDIEDARLVAVLSRIQATSHYQPLARADAVIICVPTPLTPNREPDLSALEAAGRGLGQVLQRDQLVVLESTTYPGTTREILVPRFEARGLVAGKDFFLAFSPERIDPGNRRYTLRTIPKVVGGLTRVCGELAQALYGRVADEVVPVSGPQTAEMVKLLENTFRSVNIGLVNEMAIVCDKLGVNVWEVIDAAATKPFGFMKFTPGPGIGGHCIPLDPHYLAWKMRTLNYKTRFIDLASEINSEMPAIVVRKVAQALNEEKKAVNGSRVLVLGVAYKKDIDDMRESPSLDVIRLLEQQGADVAYHDPHVPKFREDGREHSSVPLSDEELKRADAVVIVTDHSSVDYQRVVNLARVVVDTRNATAKLSKGQGRIVSLASPSSFAIA
jgi:UDP-N-acetyl-D-glucosamine dehydrogenase